MERMELTITGMTCDHCVRAVSKALGGLAGTTVEQVAIGSARVAYDPAVVSTRQLVEAVRDEGYDVVAPEVRS